MRKFFAILKREYIQRVRAKMFIVSTILLPVVMSLFGIVPALILSINAGGPMRIAVVDQTGKMYDRLEAALASDEQEAEKVAQNRSGPEIGERGFKLEQVSSIGPDASAARAKLEERIRAKELDGYLILPPDFLQTGKAEFFNNSPGDFLSGRPRDSALKRAVREQRLVEAKVDTGTRQALFQPVDVQSVHVGAPGEKLVSDSSRFVLVFAVGFIMYLAILMYGQIILG